MIRVRPKGRRNFASDLEDVLKEPVRVTRDGRRKTVSTRHATLLRQREKALAGDPRALDQILRLAQTYDGDELARAAAELSADDAEILRAYRQRLLRGTGREPPGAAAPETRRGGTGRDADAPAGDATTQEDDDDDDAWLR